MGQKTTTFRANIIQSVCEMARKHFNSGYFLFIVVQRRAPANKIVQTGDAKKC